MRSTTIASLLISSMALAAQGCATASVGQPLEPCDEGDLRVRECGHCGTETSACESGEFAEFGPCIEPPSCAGTGSTTAATGAGGTGSGSAASGGTTTSGTAGTGATGGGGGSGPCECAPGDIGTEPCGTDEGLCVSGIRERTCSAQCTWGPWGPCGGSYVGPSLETCGNAADEDCNGFVDEGCACSPVAAGASSSFLLTGAIKKLVADPNKCFVYALNGGTPSEVVVIDTKSKAELTRITLPFVATDIDISPNGAHLVVAHDSIHKISTIDTTLYTVASTISTASDPYVLEVDDTNKVYYVELDQWTDVRSVDLNIGIGSDKTLGSWALYQGDGELSADGVFLFLGESGISGGALLKYNVSGGGFTKVGESTWDDGYGFPYASRHVYLAPSGGHVYYAGHQLDGNQPAFTRGLVGELVFAEDVAGTFAIAETKVYDAELVRPIATLPQKASAAVLASADKELWYYSASTGHIYYQNVGDFLSGVTLGTRNRTPGPLSSYTISKLVHDPVRNRLYGLDTAHGCVVVIDSQTLQPTLEIVVGSMPTDFSIDTGGNYLYVGHLETMGLARIDLATPAFQAFVPTQRIPYEVEALAGTLVAVIDEDQWTTVTLLDGMSGTAYAGAPSFYEGALTATGNKSILFAGESSLSGSNIKKFAVTGTSLVKVDQSDYDQGYGFPYPPRRALAIPDGSGVFYAGYLLDGNDLSILQYQATDPIVTVTPDSKLAISQSKVYYANTGALAGSLPYSTPAQAVSPDGSTLYLLVGGGIQIADLSSY